jgi:dipeptidyl aminopeptidase/acylaminoacyl peptidase
MSNGTDNGPSDADRAASPRKSRKRSKKRRKRSFLSRVVRIAVLFAVFIGIVKIGGCADRMFFYPFAGEYPPPPRAKEVWFENEGRRLHGWWFPARNPENPAELMSDAEPDSGANPAPTIVFCHGNAFNIKRHTAFMDFLPQEGFNVFLFDYRSYGMSDKGPLHRDGLIHDASAAIDYVFTRGDVDPDRVGLYGMSLGGTIGLAAAAEDERIASVCSLATFSTWEGVSGDFVPVVGPWLISPGRDAVDTAAMLGDRPLLILHGTDDRVVNFRHAPLIVDAAERAGVDVELQRFEGAGHIGWIDSHPAMRDAIGAFFAETLARPE